MRRVLSLKHADEQLSESYFVVDFVVDDVWGELGVILGDLGAS